MLLIVTVASAPSASASSPSFLIAAGYSHSCLSSGNGAAYCWGDDTYGELGNGSSLSTGTPSPVYTGGVLSGVTLTALTAGNGFTCALSSAGAAYCWGNNADGELGDNSTASSSVPVAVTTSGVLSGVTLTQISAGEYSVCAVSSAGAAYCWGKGTSGQLGNGTATSSPVPVAVSTSGVLSGVSLSQVSAGGLGACALSSAGAAYCWGAGGSGQLGNNATGNSSVPVSVTTGGTPISGVTLSAISVGYAHACALSAGGTVYCWGDNLDGDLGSNSTTQSAVAVAVSTSGVLSGQTVSQVSAGYAHTCALLSTGTAACWGHGNDGQLGNSSTTDSSVPVSVSASGVLSGATLTTISAGQYQTCARDSNNTAFCWGLNSSGQAGNEATGVTFSVPVVVYPSAPTVISSGYDHSCVIRNGNAYCWGDNVFGALGNNSTTSSSVPVAVYTGGVLSGVTLTEIVTGFLYTCALSSAGNVYCWGFNGVGELGNNSTTSSDVPVAVYTGGVLSGLTITQLAGGFSQVCVLSSTSAPFCWGYGADGELGNGGTTSSGVPVSVTTSGALSGLVVSSITAGNAHSCAMTTSGAAFCWGSDSNGELGDGSTSTGTQPTPVAVTMTGALSGAYILGISAGGSGTCARASNGLAYCWGAGTNGELGNGGTGASDVPVAVTSGGALSGVAIAQLSMGNGGACVVSTAGAAYCWGDNSDGQLGNNNSSVSTSDVPVAVYAGGALSGVDLLQISDNVLTACALDSIGAVYCWGEGTSGQLGNNATSNSYAPVQVLNLVPAAPGGVTAFPAAASATLYWGTPSTSGTGTVTGYTATASPGGATCTSTSALTCTITGLANGTTYTVTVVTVTTDGNSYPSAAATVTPWPSAANMEAGGLTSCILSGGAPYCWGYNVNGEVGNGTSASPVLSPVAVTASGVLSGLTLTQISVGQEHGCALSSAGQAYCWGYNADGQLGNNSTANSSVPVAVYTGGVLSGVTLTQISAGQFDTCALSTTGAAYCWGDDAQGQLGNNSTSNSDVPVAVSTSGALSGVTLAEISASSALTCALSATGAAYCWGDDTYGELGNNTTSTTPQSTPVAVYTGGALSGVALAGISAGYTTACALSEAGTAYCWGNNGSGEVGNNSTTSVSVPTAVYAGGALSGVTVTQLSASQNDTCALSSAGAAYCWGDNSYDELGTGNNSQQLVPAAVYTGGALSGVTVTQISAGPILTCALSSAGTAYCWGNGFYGGLGNNTTSQVSAAVLVGPQAPTGVGASAGNGTASVSWTAPVFLNNGTLTSYTASASPGGATCSSSSATSCTLSGLTDGTSYTITVATTASTGTSAPSASTTATPVGFQITAPSTLTWNVTGSGLNQAVVDSVAADQGIAVNDGSGAGAGWHLTFSATTFSSGGHTLPDTGAIEVNGSTTALTGSAPSSACVGSCTLPTNPTTYPVVISTAASSPTAYTIYDASAGTGIGVVAIGGSGAAHPIGWWVNVPASVYAGTYATTVTLSLVSGP